MIRNPKMKPLLSNQQIGIFYAILSGLCYSLLGLFGMPIIKYSLSLPTMLFWRYLVSGLFMALLLFIYKKFKFYHPRSLARTFIFGGVFYGIGSLSYFAASIYIGSGLAMVIFFTYPVMVLLFNKIFYRTNAHNKNYVSIFVILIGLIFLADFTGIGINYKGFLIGLFSAFFYTCYVMANKNNPIEPWMSTFMVSLGCALISLLVALNEQSFSIPQSLDVWLNIFGIAIICTALPILLFLESLKYITSERAAILSVLEPVFMIIIGILFLNEKITAIQTVGISVILLGALISLSP